ncbi:hypothetical protein CBS9595_003210 [Malassezia furfur]|nr:hypothetical protein CBS9595_003210 [Malassezia furfur]
MEWEVDELDLSAYLRRINHPPVDRATTESLHSLCKAHVLSIPFENLDPACGIEPSLVMKDVQSKIIDQQRGGYCFEHILLFSAALEQMGYRIYRRISRVFPDKPGTTTHVLVEVYTEDNDGKWMADVGFGGGILHPMPIRFGAMVDQLGFLHRIVRNGPFWRLEKKEDSEKWVAQHEWSELPIRKVDFIVLNHYTATSPRSPFFGRPVVLRIKNGMLHKLVGNKIYTVSPGKPDVSKDVQKSNILQVLKSLDLDISNDIVRHLQENWSE